MGIRLRSAGVAAATVVLLAAGLPAQADVAGFPDARGDTSHPADIVRVRVAHGAERVEVKIFHRNLTFEPDGAPRRVRVGFDVGPRHRGPEFYVGEPYQADPVVQLRHATGWGGLSGRPVDGCVGEQITVSSARDLTTLTVPRACLGDPGRLRVNALVKSWPRQARPGDAAPGRARSGPWVAL
jgi:hypothetical protein